MLLNTEYNDEFATSPLARYAGWSRYLLNHKKTKEERIEHACLTLYGLKRSLVKLGFNFYEHIYSEHDTIRYIMAFRKMEMLAVRLTADDKRKALEWSKKNDITLESMSEVLSEDGIKISFSYYGDKDAFIVTLTGSKDNLYNENKVMSTWAADIMTGIQWALYKHVVMFNREEWFNDDPTATFG